MGTQAKGLAELRNIGLEESGFQLVSEMETEGEFDVTATRLHADGSVCDCNGECVEWLEENDDNWKLPLFW